MLEDLAKQWLNPSSSFRVPQETEFFEQPLSGVFNALESKATSLAMLRALWVEAATDGQRLATCAVFLKAYLLTLEAQELKRERQWLSHQVKSCSVEVRFVWDCFFPSAVYSEEDGETSLIDRELDLFDGYEYQADRWFEYKRSLASGHDVLDWTGAWYFVDDALSSLSTMHRMLETLWKKAEAKTDYELILEQFHDSTKFGFHPTAIASARSWILKRVQDLPQGTRDYWRELDSDRPSTDYWEKCAHGRAKDLQGQVENSKLFAQDLPLWGIDSKRISEFWPEDQTFTAP